MRLDDLTHEVPRFDPTARTATAKPTKAVRLKADRQADRAHAQARERCRLQVFTEDRGRCRNCHKKLVLKLRDARHAFELANIHEWVPRSLGGDDCDPRNCLTLCAECHEPVTAHRVEIVACDEQRLMRGDVEFIPGGNQ